MTFTMGLILLVYSVCTFAAIKSFLVKASPIPGIEDAEERRAATRRRDAKATVIALAITVSLWYLQNQYHHHWSPYAEGCQKFGELLDKWDAGRRAEVMAELNSMALEERPWERSTSEDDPE